MTFRDGRASSNSTWGARGVPTLPGRTIGGLTDEDGPKPPTDREEAPLGRLRGPLGAYPWGVGPAARRIEVTAGMKAIDTLANPSYTVSFAVPVTKTRTPEQWARAVFEAVSAGMRWYLRIGWKYGLWLNLGPRSSPEHIAGWRILDSTSQVIILEAESPLLVAHNVIQVGNDFVRLTTSVRYERRLGRVLWSVAAPLHVRTIPHLMRHASESNQAD